MSNSNSCTCVPLAFAPDCAYCHEKFWNAMEQQKIELLQIREKNMNENKCNCIDFAGMRIYECKACFYEWQKLKYNQRRNKRRNQNIII